MNSGTKFFWNRTKKYYYGRREVVLGLVSKKKKQKHFNFLKIQKKIFENPKKNILKIQKKNT